MHGTAETTTTDRSTRTPLARQAPAVALRIALLAGLVVAAGSHTAHADVIYTATPGLTIDLSSGPILLDLDGDGTIDLTIEAYSSPWFDELGILLYDGSGTGTSRFVVVDSVELPLVAAIPTSTFIGPDDEFDTAFGFLWTCWPEARGKPCFGEWLEATDAYVGARFISAAGETHYGWVHVVGSTVWPENISAEVIGYAYETSPNTPICTGLSPEPCGVQVLGDLNGDGVVDGADLGLLLNNWGGEGVGDLNGDGIVDGADLGVLLNNWS